MTNQYQSIVDKMKSENHWCVFTKGKFPCDNSGKEKGVLKREYSYNEAKQLQQDKGYPYSGVIIDKGLCCIDLDHCIMENGEFKKWAVDIMERFKDCYMEYSTRKQGVHIYFYITKEQVQQLYAVNYRTQAKKPYEIEFYFKLKTRGIIFTGNSMNKEKQDYSTYVSFPTLQSFLETYMKWDNACNGNTKNGIGKNGTDNSPSGMDFHRMCKCVSYANGDEDLTQKLFFQSNPKEREGQHKDKWHDMRYVKRTFQAAKNTEEADLKSSCKAMPKNGDDRYLYFGEKFFKSIQENRKAFVRSKNYLYSFLRILWEANRQYSEGINCKIQKIIQDPCILVSHNDIAKIMDCSSYKKAIDILKNLEALGYLQYRGVYDLYITVKKFYAKNEYGTYTFQKNYVRLDKAIFEDYFLRKKCKSSKLDLLLYLYANAEYCSREEYRKRIRCVYVVAFGYRYDNEHKHRQKRYDISEKDLSSFLNIRSSTLCEQLMSLQELHYIYMSENGSRYNRGIFITLCNFDAFKFRKYGVEGEIVHETAHKEMRDVLKIRNLLVDTKAKITKANFLNRKEDESASLEVLECAA